MHPVNQFFPAHIKQPFLPDKPFHENPFIVAREPDSTITQKKRFAHFAAKPSLENDVDGEVPAGQAQINQ